MVGAIADQSPLSAETNELFATVVIVPIGAPEPTVRLLAGVAASCAPVHRSTTIECQLPEDALAGMETVRAVPPAVTIPVHSTA